ncbi:MAG: sulfurtransferase TusA family protein [Planctomycetota bacterium]
MIVIDAKGMHCPMPIVQVARERIKLKNKDTFEVISDDNAFPNDIKAWCTQTGSELVKIENKENCFVATIIVHPSNKSLRFGQ